jgi:sporulation protein YlmC with PRC-barrel domain
MSIVALSELLGAGVRDTNGTVCGRVREVALAPQDHPARVAFLIVRTTTGEQVLTARDVKAIGPVVRATTDPGQWESYTPSIGSFLLKRDLLDRQIIDVHGRKVVRVNDVELDSTPTNNHLQLSVLSVDVGTRGAVRRIAKGLVPAFTLRALLEKIPPRVIPWHLVDLLETDPALGLTQLEALSPEPERQFLFV